MNELERKLIDSISWPDSALRALLAEVKTLRTENEQLKRDHIRYLHWEKRAVASMNDASRAVGVDVCDQIPSAIAWQLKRTLMVGDLIAKIFETLK